MILGTTLVSLVRSRVVARPAWRGCPIIYPRLGEIPTNNAFGFTYTLQAHLVLGIQVVLLVPAAKRETQKIRGKSEIKGGVKIDPSPLTE